jgi:hypothetical protein
MGRYTRRHGRKLENAALIAQALGALGQIPATILRNKQHDEATKSLEGYRRATLDLKANEQRDTAKFHQGQLDRQASGDLLRASQHESDVQSREKLAGQTQKTQIDVAKIKAGDAAAAEQGRNERNAASIASRNQIAADKLAKGGAGGQGNARLFGAEGMASYMNPDTSTDTEEQKKIKAAMKVHDDFIKAGQQNQVDFNYPALAKEHGSELARLSEALGASKRKQAADMKNAPRPAAGTDDGGAAMPGPSLHDATPEEEARLRASVQGHTPDGPPAPDTGLPTEGQMTPPVGSPEHDQRQGQQLHDDYHAMMTAGHPDRMNAWLRTWQKFPGIGRPPRDVLAAAGMGESGQMAFNVAGMGASVLPGPLQGPAQMLGTSALTPHIAEIMAQLGLGFPGAAASQNPEPGPAYGRLQFPYAGAGGQ